MSDRFFLNHRDPARRRRDHTPLARLMQIIMLPEFGDACRAAGDLPAAAEAWQQA